MYTGYIDSLVILVFLLIPNINKRELYHISLYQNGTYKEKFKKSGLSSLISSTGLSIRSPMDTRLLRPSPVGGDTVGPRLGSSVGAGGRPSSLLMFSF